MCSGLKEVVLTTSSVQFSIFKMTDCKTKCSNKSGQSPCRSMKPVKPESWGGGVSKVFFIYIIKYTTLKSCGIYKHRLNNWKM